MILLFALVYHDKKIQEGETRGDLVKLDAKNINNSFFSIR